MTLPPPRQTPLPVPVALHCLSSSSSERTHLASRERPVTPKLTCRGIDPGHDNLQKQQQQLSPAAATTTSTAHSPAHPARAKGRGGERGEGEDEKDRFRGC